MLDYGRERTRSLIRQFSRHCVDINKRIEETNVDNALSYFERRTDTDEVRAKYKNRVGIGIRKKEGESGYETYTKSRVAEMIDQGELEVVSSGIGQRIIRSRATLFTNPTQHWEWSTPGRDDYDEGVRKIITEQRALGGMESQIINANFIACAVGTGPLLVDVAGGHISYNAFAPSAIYLRYCDTILDSGYIRGVNYSSLDDAYCVVVLLSGTRNSDMVSPEKNQYVAYFGASDVYEYGRRVYYEAYNWRDIPEPDASNTTCQDYRLLSGKIANPLTWVSIRYPELSIPEYPICLFNDGSIVTNSECINVSSSLYESCLEIDVAMSRLIKDSLNSARGKDVITNEFGRELPRCLEGAVVLHKGQTLNIMGQPVSNAQGALDIVKDIARSVAEGYGVPGYMVITTTEGQPESGIALYIRAQSLIDDRDRMVKTNKEVVDRLWRLERGTWLAYTGKQIGTSDTKQIWNPGRIVLPVTEKDKAEQIKTSLDAGLIDYVRAVRDYHNLPTDKHAQDFIEKMNERSEQYMQPTTRGSQRTGLPLGMALGSRPARDSR